MYFKVLNNFYTLYLIKYIDIEIIYRKKYKAYAIMYNSLIIMFF